MPCLRFRCRGWSRVFHFLMVSFLDCVRFLLICIGCVHWGGRSQPVALIAPLTGDGIDGIDGIDCIH